jgi:hypothetical protein
LGVPTHLAKFGKGNASLLVLRTVAQHLQLFPQLLPNIDETKKKQLVFRALLDDEKNLKTALSSSRKMIRPGGYWGERSCFSHLANVLLTCILESFYFDIDVSLVTFPRFQVLSQHHRLLLKYPLHTY